MRRVRRGEPLKEARSSSKLLLQLHYRHTVLPLPHGAGPVGEGEDGVTVVELKQ